MLLCVITIAKISTGRPTMAEGGVSEVIARWVWRDNCWFPLSCPNSLCLSIQCTCTLVCCHSDYGIPQEWGKEGERGTDFLSFGPEERQQVSMRNKLRDKTQWLLGGDTSHHVHDVRVVALCNLFHHLNFIQKV